MQKATRVVIAVAGAAAGLVLLVPVVLLAVPFWIVSALQSTAKRALARSRPATIPWQEMMDYEPVIGWKPRPRIDAWAEGTPPFHVRTDDDGWRGPGATIEDADVVVFGDSFAFGHGADEDRFFANLPGGPTIKAIGANGYSMVQGLLWMRRYADRLGGKTVVWLVYYGNDLYENLRPNMGRYRMPFVRHDHAAGAWKIETAHVSADRWRFSNRVRYGDILAEICCAGHLSDRVFDACDHLIGEASRLTSQIDARLVVVGIPTTDTLDEEQRTLFRNRSPDPDKFDPELPDRRLAAASLKHGVAFCSLSDWMRLSDYLPEDVHWTPGGHDKFAKVLAQLHLDSLGEFRAQARQGRDEPALLAAGE
jgi:hypothetical protein